MEEYKSNSHKSKEARKELPEKKVEKVVSGKVTTKKKNEMQKFADVFVSEDVRNVKTYILKDILIPTIKKAIDDIVGEGIHMILYGGSGRSKSNSSSSRTPYRRYYDERNDRDSYGRSYGRSSYDYNNIILDNRGEAEDVLSRMDDLIDVYGVVSVADLYDLVGVTGSYTDNKYGWTDIRSATVVRVRGDERGRGYWHGSKCRRSLCGDNKSK